MGDQGGYPGLEQFKQSYPAKFADEKEIFSKIHPGNRIFIGTACAEPQYLVNALVDYVESHPKAFFDAEVLQVWTLGVAAYTQEKFKSNFRHNSFFIGDNTAQRRQCRPGGLHAYFSFTGAGSFQARHSACRRSDDSDVFARPSRICEPGSKRGHR